MMVFVQDLYCGQRGFVGKFDEMYIWKRKKPSSLIRRGGLLMCCCILGKPSVQTIMCLRVDRTGVWLRECESVCGFSSDGDRWHLSQPHRAFTQEALLIGFVWMQRSTKRRSHYPHSSPSHGSATDPPCTPPDSPSIQLVHLLLEVQQTFPLLCSQTYSRSSKKINTTLCCCCSPSEPHTHTHILFLSHTTDRAYWLPVFREGADRCGGSGVRKTRCGEPGCGGVVPTVQDLPLTAERGWDTLYAGRVI